MNWHDNSNTRKAIGDAAEQLFTQMYKCSCGGSFKFIGNLRAGFPDFTCEVCGQLVDVKASPQAERTGNISVSAIPWKNYADDMLLVTCVKGRWIGEYKRNIRVQNQTPNDPTHHGRGTYGNTQWHLISWRNFRPIETIGLIANR